MKRLIIAEKPDLAKAIRDAIPESFESRQGYYESDTYIIAYCYGHMLALKDPEDFDKKYKEWKLADLPIYFSPWGKKPIAQSSSQLEPYRVYWRVMLPVN